MQRFINAEHAYAPRGVRYVQMPEHFPPKPQPRHAAFSALGDQISAIFGPYFVYDVDFWKLSVIVASPSAPPEP